MVGIHHFGREHPPNSGTGFLILGQHSMGSTTPPHHRVRNLRLGSLKICGAVALNNPWLVLHHAFHVRTQRSHPPNLHGTPQQNADGWRGRNSLARSFAARIFRGLALGQPHMAGPQVRATQRVSRGHACGQAKCAIMMTQNQPAGLLYPLWDTSHGHQPGYSLRGCNDPPSKSEQLFGGLVETPLISQKVKSIDPTQ